MALAKRLALSPFAAAGTSITEEHYEAADAVTDVAAGC
jgi:hypothetical protein